MDMAILQDLVRPELLILVPFCWLVGQFIRKGEMVVNKYIPSVLWIVAIVFSFLYLAVMLEVDLNIQQIIVSSILNGTFIAAIAVFGNEQYKQYKDIK